MQQRQLRLGDILDDYCPRERRLTNHAVVAMVGDEVKQTRCTTCDADHAYKHAKVPRQRRKDSLPAVQAPVTAAVPRRVAPDASPPVIETAREERVPLSAGLPPRDDVAEEPDDVSPAVLDADDDEPVEMEGPAHRRLIRATLPRPEGQPPASRQAPDFTIRHPAAGRPNRFRPRTARGAGQQTQGNRFGSPGGSPRGGASKGGPGRPPLSSHSPRRHDGGRKRSK